MLVPARCFAVVSDKIMTKAPFNQGVTLKWFQPAYLLGLSFLLLSACARVASQPPGETPSPTFFQCIPGELVVAFLVALLPFLVRVIVSHLQSHIRDTQLGLRKLLAPYLDLAVCFFSLALLILASYVWRPVPSENGSDRPAYAKRELGEIINEAAQVFDQEKNHITPQFQNAVGAAYLETLANRVRNVKIESAQTPTTSRSSVKSQYFLLVALVLAVAGSVYALVLYQKRKKELKKFSGSEAYQCENGDFEKIRAKLESLDTRVTFALLHLGRKSRKRKD
jgi:hypothetical protein